MTAYDYDLVVLGVGPAGERGAAQAAYFGKRVVCIERAPEPGGAAVHTGTLPSKTRLPKYAAWTAPFSPAGPPPMTTRS